MATSTSLVPIAFLTDARLLRIRVVKVLADRPTVGPAGTMEFTCTVGVGAANAEKKAIIKVELEAVGKSKPDTSGEVKKDFSVTVECRSTYEWPYAVKTSNFEALEVRNVLCQPTYIAARARLKDLLAGMGVLNVRLPYDIRGDAADTEEEGKMLEASSAVDKKDKPTSAPAKVRKVARVKASAK